MSYILSTSKNYHSLIKYENEISIDYKKFLTGKKITSDLPIIFTQNKNVDIKKIISAPVLDSSGPKLICEKMKNILESIVLNVQFLKVDVEITNFKKDSFFAINPIYKIECLDLAKCEYKVINFDANNPEYMFYCAVIKEEILEDNNLDIVICKELSPYLVVSEKVKTTLVNTKIKGLRFYKTLDITPKGRSIYEDI